MATSLKKFRVEMYLEHLEECAFFFDQVRALAASPELPWTKLAEFEDRLEAHLDALVVGADDSLNVCRDRAASGEVGELFAIVSVYCRVRHANGLAEVWRTLDFNDPARVGAVAQALNYELPAEWHSACEQSLVRGDEQLFSLIASVCGYRRVPYGEQIAKRIAGGAKISPQIPWSLSRLPASPSIETLLRSACTHEDTSVRSAAHIALLRAGKRDKLRSCLAVAESEEWPQKPLGLGGDRAAAAALRRRIDTGNATQDTVLAASLLGDVTVVRSLIGLLTHDELGGAAAWALYWITGAALFENVFVTEEVDEAALFEKELQAWRERQEMPRRADGQAFGANVRQLVRDPAKWNEWLAANAARFSSDYRYRRGQLYSARALLGCLLDGAAPNALRQLAYEELTIRFGCDIPFESDFRVKDQRIALQSIANWVATNEARLDTGRW